ncbi:MAG: alpha/beta fold hydrolase [Pseudomonadota bacterium]
MHVLEAGYETPGRPAVMLLHGFPELSYSWRKILVPLAQAGVHVIAPDLRGYGRTTGWDSDYDADLAPFGLLNKVRDVIGLSYALGYEQLAAVIGHDFGSPLAAWCGLTRPDIFQSVVMMSAPFGGPPAIPFAAANSPKPNDAAGFGIFEDLATLERPRKHYVLYYTTRGANEDMWHAAQGLQDFMRAYYHHKSGDWKQNKPFRLAAGTAKEWAKMPTYYIIDLEDGMAETVAREMPSPEHIAANAWLTDRELAVYAQEFGRTGFQGGLNSYRAAVGQIESWAQELYSGKTIDQPSLYISGACDWGTYQSPGEFERMQNSACTDMRGAHFIDGAGHWVQQEKPEDVSRRLVAFLESLE